MLLDHEAENGEALAVRVAPAAEVELGLVVDADEEAAAAVPGASRAMEIALSTCFRPVIGVVSWTMGGSISFRRRRRPG